MSPFKLRLRIPLVTRGAVKRLAVFVIALTIAIGWCGQTMIRMPGKSFRGPLPELTGEQAALADAMRSDIEAMAGDIGPRAVVLPGTLDQSAAFLRGRLEDAGYEVTEVSFDVANVTCSNLVVELPGASAPDEIVVVGAHYDSVVGYHLQCPGANDNGSGVAGTLALAEMFADKPCRRTIRFVCFVNEEPPYFQTADMGSWVYAKHCHEQGDNVVAMVTLETIGCYSDEKGSQSYPFPLSVAYPSTGNFIAFVGNYSSRKLVREAIASFRNHADFPSQGGAVPGFLPGVGWSDHWAFWQEGYPAIMITDTAPYRYPHYHKNSDTADKIDYERMARVVDGMQHVIVDLAGGRE